MKTKIKRVLSFLLLVTVCVTNIQMPALAAETYSVTAADTEHGKILLNGEEKDIKLEKGSEVTVSAIPDEGYKLENITAVKEDGSENGLKETDNGYVTEIQDSDVTVEASFVRDATTSDLEALFGPKAGEEDTRLSAKAWKKTQEAQGSGTDRSAYADYTASRQWYDVTIGTNDNSGNVIWQWTEGMLYVGGRLTFCMDAKSTFYEGVQYTPTDASALGLSQAEVTRLALYQEYIYNQRSDLDELGKYMFSQMLMWRELNEYYKWGWPNIHIFDAGYWWADVSYQEQVLSEAVAWVNEQQQSGRYTGHGEFFVHDRSQAQALFWLEENTGGLELYKKSKKPEITNGNSAYSLAGAQYGVYRDGGDYVNPDAVITTDENGYGWVDGLPVGNYWIKELVAPKGYALDSSWSPSTVAVPGGAYGQYYTSDMPINDPVTIVLGKVDADKTSGMTETELKKLEGAQFEVKYYAVDPNAYNSDPGAAGVKAARTWLLKTLYDKRENAVTAKLDEEHKISGDSFYYDGFGRPSFPIGIITIKEIKAPKGYLVSDETFVRKVTEDGIDDPNVDTYNAPTVEEVAQKMQIRLQKVDKETGKAEAQGTASLKGAVYEVKDTAGKTVDTLTTDAAGKATSKELPIDTYTVKETKASNGYLLDDKTYTIKGEATDTTTKVFQYDVKSQETPQKIQIQLNKVDAENGTAQGTATLKGAQYEIRNAKNEVVETLTTDEKGKAASKKLPLGNYTVKETKASYGYLLDDKTYTIEGNATDTTTQVFQYAVTSKEVPQKIQIQLNKVDAENGTAQGAATLKGAKYEIRNAKDQVVATLTTDENGKATSEKLPLGKYTVKETKASYGYLLDDKTYTIKGEATDTTTRVFQYDVKSQETPQKIQIELSKLDSETNAGKPQGAATLKGAKYEIRNPKGELVETLVTDKKGKAISKELPLDQYVVKETEASNGYLVDENGYTVKGKATDTTTRVFKYQINSPEDIIRGNVEIIKLKENEDEDNDTLQGLEGVEFTFTSKTTGKEVLKITTDENGFATTASKEHPRGGLVFDTYIVTETKCPEGLKPIEPFEVTIKDEGVTLKGIYKEDKLILSPITVVKVDASTGKVIPVANTEFRLLDENKKPITMTTYYPNKVVHETFKTDENGQFTFPEKLKYGTYYLEELHAPEGYLKGELLPFKVTEGSTWEKPLVVQYADENAMGKIQIQKTDAEAKTALANAVFEITAAEDIITPDGTVRLQKGEVADTITSDDTGKAESKDLFLGKYTVKEKQQPDGYLLNEKKYEVELKYKDQNTTLITESLDITNQPTKVEVVKTDKETGKPIEGVEFSVWNKAMFEDTTDQIGVKETFATDKDGKITLKYLVPGTYCIQETKTLPGYVLDEKIYEIKIDKSGRIDGEDSGLLEISNIPTKLIGTTAKDQDTQTHEAIPQKETTFVDTVKFKDLQIGQEYTIKGILMDKETGKPLMVNGKEVTAETTFTAKEADGTVDVVFTFDASALKGHSIVVFEKVFIGEKEILAHEDLNDKEQTVTFPESKIQTSAKDQDTDTHEAVPKKETTFIDTVRYENLIIGQEYTVKGTLMDKETGKPLLINEKQVTAQKTFTPEKSSGSIDLTFTFDASALKGHSIVVFEKLLAEDVEVAAHEDINDEGQTVRFPNSEIKTIAVDKDTQMHEGLAKKETTIVDTIAYKNLIPGQEYTVKGTLMSKETGEALLVDEKPITAEKTFTPEKAAGTVDLEFTFDSSALKGKTVVVFEKVYADEVEVAVHADIEDQDQSVSFPNIHTSAIDKETQGHEPMPKEETTIVDTVAYENLTVGREYTVKGKLMLKETEEPLLVNGKEVTAETTFIPESENGSVDVEFTFDASALSGKSVVVFERLYTEEMEVAVHTDIQDDGQTVTFQTPPGAPPVKTGDSTGISGILLALLLGSTAVISFILYRKKKQA